MEKIIYKADSKKSLNEKQFKIIYECYKGEDISKEKFIDTFNAKDIEIILQTKMDDKDIDSLWLIVLKDYALDRHFCFYMMCEDKTLEPLLKMLSGKKIDSVEINAYKRSRAVSQVEKDEYFCDIYTGYTEILSAADMTFGINLEKYLL